MLVYEKMIDGARHLFGTMGIKTDESDKELIYLDRDGEAIDFVDRDSYVNGTDSYSIMRVSDNKYVDVYIETEEENVNIIPGNLEPLPAKEVTSIEVTTLPTKTEYNIGEKLDLSGIEITVTFDDGETTTKTSGFTSEPANGTILDTEGTVTVTISYKEKTSSFDINVVDTSKVTIYYGLTKEKAVSKEELPSELVNKEAIISAGEITKVEQARSVDELVKFINIAIPSDIGTIKHIYVNDDRSIDNISNFEVLADGNYQTVFESVASVFDEEITLHFMLN